LKLSSSAKTDFSKAHLPRDEGGLEGFGCDFCDALVKALEEFLEGNHTEAEALAYMEQVSCNTIILRCKNSACGATILSMYIYGHVFFQLCEQLTNQKLLCKAFVNTEGKTILDKLLAKLAPEQICEDIGLCP
jgi:hypothetical protein